MFKHTAKAVHSKWLQHPTWYGFQCITGPILYTTAAALENHDKHYLPSLLRDLTIKVESLSHKEKNSRAIH